LQEQLLQAQKMEAIGQLTGGVAHDFNNLLQVINGCTEIALEELPPGHLAREVLEEVEQAGDRAARLVSQLLLFSRRQVMRLEWLDLNDTVSDLLKMVGRVIGEDVKLQWHPGSNIGALYADRGMVEHALVNLCVNARDAMPEAGTLIIRTESTEIDDAYHATHSGAEPGHYAVLSVSDTGHGMDKETAARVFEPCFTTKERGKGTGLGLATVYGILKQHKGMVSLYSEEGKGTVFRLYWPEDEDGERKTEQTGAVTVRGGDETILLAEDDEMVRNLAKRILERAGYTVLMACDGEEAVSLFERQSNEIDMAVMDVVMPGMGGRTACECMQAMRPDFPVLFASGYSEDSIHTDFVLDRGVRLLQKPFVSEALLRSVRETLDGAANAG